MTHESGAKPRRARRRGRGPIALALAAAFLLTGCEGMFDVTNPGRILDTDLNNVEGVGALVVGMSAALSEGYDDQSFMVARTTDEMAGTGSYFNTGLWRRGVINREDVNFLWDDAQEARWVAEAGLLRMQEDIEGYEFEGNELTARGYLLAGFSNRWLGEQFCNVTFSEPYEDDTGEMLPKSAAFERGIDHFENAITHAEAAGTEDAEEVVTAATAGLAQMYANLGDWETATTYSEEVDTDFVYEAVYSNNSASERNVFWAETHGRYEMSAFSTLAGSFDPPEPRAPYTDCREAGDACSSDIGADGTHPHLRQEKFPEQGSDIPIAKGTEMRLIEAEAALRGGDASLAIERINEVRAHYGLDPIPEGDVEVTGTTPDAITGEWDSMRDWDVLDRERHLTLWLEGRRLWDLHRWDHPFLDGGTLIEKEGYIAEGRRDSCLPISFNECQTNPNLDCT